MNGFEVGKMEERDQLGLIWSRDTDIVVELAMDFETWGHIFDSYFSRANGLADRFESFEEWEKAGDI